MLELIKLTFGRFPNIQDPDVSSMITLIFNPLAVDATEIPLTGWANHMAFRKGGNGGAWKNADHWNAFLNLSWMQKFVFFPQRTNPRFSASELCHLSPSAQAAPAWCQPPAPCKGHRALGSGAAMELLLGVQPQQSRVLTSVKPNKCVYSKGGCSGHSRGEGNVPAVTWSMGRDHPQQAGSAAGRECLRGLPRTELKE